MGPHLDQTGCSRQPKPPEQFAFVLKLTPRGRGLGADGCGLDHDPGLISTALRSTDLCRVAGIQRSLDVVSRNGLRNRFFRDLHALWFDFFVPAFRQIANRLRRSGSQFFRSVLPRHSSGRASRSRRRRQQGSTPGAWPFGRPGLLGWSRQKGSSRRRLPRREPPITLWLRQRRRRYQPLMMRFASWPDAESCASVQPPEGLAPRTNCAAPCCV